ncbi:MAG TPA: PEP-CTERM sorting domain-containing protein [Methylomirabilota bacterium]|nr:PEP-CTERM sorting domain-containing protein [Methylomirabilota bacterium]
MRPMAGTLGVMLAVTMWAAPVAAIDLTFDDVVSAGNPAVGAVESDGYRIAGPALHTIDTPGSLYVDSGSPVYLAQVDGGTGAGLTLRRINGTAFDLYEFAAARLFASPAGGAGAERVALLGLGVGGTTLGATYDLAAAGFSHFLVPPTWSHLEAVVFQGLLAGDAAGPLALDDIGVGTGPGPSAVPEPATIVLALTALAIGAVLLGRRRF